MNQPSLSIIIPVFREVATIGHCLQYLRQCDRIEECEIIVVDGDDGSSHTPHDIVAVTVVNAPARRGTQLNVGRAAANAPNLLFLHVDTLLPGDFVQRVLDALEAHPAGAFDLHIDTRNPVTKLISAAGRLRSRLTRIPYGDQAQFIRSGVFDSVGGFPDEPLMEDVALMDRLKAAGHRIVVLRPPAKTSDRRWREEGAVQCTLRNWKLMIAYRRGTSPRDLAKHYKPRPVATHQVHERLPRSARVLVFHRALVPGRVKTRLARDIGDQPATDIYQAMVQDLRENLEPLKRTVIPFIDQQTAGRDLFGNSLPQEGATLEERMHNAFKTCFSQSGVREAVLIGSDIPGLTAERIRESVGALRIFDVVVGRSVNGGYYLIGFRRDSFRPILQDNALQRPGDGAEDPFTTLISVIEKSGLTWGEVGSLCDIDTLSDLKTYRLTYGEVSEPEAAKTAHLDAAIRALPGHPRGH